MHKETIQYETYDGVPVEEDFYFNLSKAELMRMEMSQYGGMEALLQKIIKEQDSKRIYNMFEEIVQKAYGVKSDDGKQFIKNEEVLNKFVQSEAYSVLVMKMLEDADFSAKFVRNVFPKDIQDKLDKEDLPKRINNPIPAPPEK